MRAILMLVGLLSLVTGCSLVGEELEVRTRQADGSEVVQVISHRGGVTSLHGAEYGMTMRKGTAMLATKCASLAGTHTLYCEPE